MTLSHSNGPTTESVTALPPEETMGNHVQKLRESSPAIAGSYDDLSATNASETRRFLLRKSARDRSPRMYGGPSRNRTGVQGFAVLCVTTPPSGPDRDGPHVMSGRRRGKVRGSTPMTWRAQPEALGRAPRASESGPLAVRCISCITHLDLSGGHLFP